jgi:GntP family gluconate:H+ symporter
LLPIVLPILLIVGKSIIDLNYNASVSNTWIDLARFVGSPVIALFIGMLLSFLLPKKLDQDLFSISGWVGKALLEASNIMLITGAGGIFGSILQNSGVADVLSDTLSQFNLGIWLPFLLSAAIKTAQGSSTVALITTASILAPVLSSLGVETELQKALFVAAIGAGSAVVSHANDSAFWVVTQLTGMNVKQGYRLYTTGTLLVGVTSAIVIFIISLLIG